MRSDGRRPSKKDAIARCFSGLVAERGFDGVSLRDVAEELDISKGTIVHHFQSKDKLLEYVQVSYMQERVAEARAMLTELESPVDQLTAFVCHLLRGTHSERDDTVTFARGIFRISSDPSLKRVRDLRDQYSGMMQRVIERGIEDGDFVGLDATVVTLQIFGMCNWSWTWYRANGRSTPIEIAEVFMALILDGLRGTDARGGYDVAAVDKIVVDIMDREEALDVA